jgi:hypothetical protein
MVLMMNKSVDENLMRIHTYFSIIITAYLDHNTEGN